MPDTFHQRIEDSEENYLNTTFWDIQPLFLLLRNGMTEPLRAGLNLQLDRFPEGRITRDRRKQLEYLAVSLVNTFMIAAIEGGVYPPDANAAADHALHRLSQIRNVAEITGIIEETAIRLCEMVVSSRLQDSGNEHVEAARHFMSSHLTQEIRMEDVASAAGVSLYHLSRLFREKTGRTMREYLTSERIAMARQLLAASDYSILQIASLLRFCDQSHFTLAFRRETGQTPGQYRRENQIQVAGRQDDLQDLRRS